MSAGEESVQVAQKSWMVLAHELTPFKCTAFSSNIATDCCELRSGSYHLCRSVLGTQEEGLTHVRP